MRFSCVGSAIGSRSQPMASDGWVVVRLYDRLIVGLVESSFRRESWNADGNVLCMDYWREKKAHNFIYFSLSRG